MTLSCDKPWGSKSYGPGMFISQVTVLQAEDVSGQQAPFLQRPYDIGIKLTLDIGKDFHPQLTIAGEFKRDPVSNEVIGWGSAFVVQEALARTGYTGNLDPGNKLPATALSGLIGKRFLRLSYISGRKDDGRIRYSDWNHIASLDEGGDELAKRFRRSLAKGYPKNYHPELVEEASTLSADVTASIDDPF